MFEFNSKEMNMKAWKYFRNSMLVSVLNKNSKQNWLQPVTSVASYLMKWGVLIHHKKGDKNGIKMMKRRPVVSVIRVNAVGISKDESE